MNIEHFALQVADPVAMADWYVRHLGFSIARQTGPPVNARFLLEKSGCVMLEIYHNLAATVPDRSKDSPLLLHLAFLSHNLPSDRDRLISAGARLVEDVSNTPGGDQILMLRDPWGLPIQFVKRAEPMIGT